MNQTRIEWVKNPDGTQGYTWNPITGCNNHINGMCKGGGFPCYAYRLANTRLKEIYLANKNTATQNYDEDSYPFYPRFWEERLVGAFTKLQHKKGRGVFVCDMSDLFGKGIPEAWTSTVLYTINKLPQHRFYLLTKQPQNLVKFSPFPDNCWVGVTITRSDQYILHHMMFVKAKIKFISFEPLLNWNVDMGSLSKSLKTAGINWVIIGAQTNPSVYPKIEWVREIVEAADRAGVKVFLKDNLRELLVPDALMNDIFWESEKAKLRQEMPG